MASALAQERVRRSLSGPELSAEVKTQEAGSHTPGSDSAGLVAAAGVGQSSMATCGLAIVPV